jgi:hypothetical protein
MPVAKSAVVVNLPPAHGYIDQHAFAGEFLAAESDRKFYFQGVVFTAILLDPDVPNTAFKRAETMATELASKRIKVKKAE